MTVQGLVAGRESCVRILAQNQEQHARHKVQAEAEVEIETPIVLGL